VDQCPRCKAYVQAEWDGCRICGLARLPDTPVERPPTPPPGAAGDVPTGTGAPAGDRVGAGVRPGRPPTGAAPVPPRRGGTGFAVTPATIAFALVGLVLVVAAGAWALRPSDPPPAIVATGETPLGSLPSSTTTSVAVVPPPNAPDGPPDAPRPTSDEIDQFCAGGLGSLPGAAPYPGDLGPVHVVAVQPHGLGWVSDTIGSEWLATWNPNRHRPVELVFCGRFVESGEVVDCGRYETVQVSLARGTWVVEVRSAADGTVLASTELPGAVGCPPQVYVGAESGTEVTRKEWPDPGAATAFVSPFALAP
jgi:hypothetical protein